MLATYRNLIDHMVIPLIYNIMGIGITHMEYINVNQIKF